MVGFLSPNDSDSDDINDPFASNEDGEETENNEMLVDDSDEDRSGGKWDVHSRR